MIARERNRRTVAVDYDYPQQFYTKLPEVQQECVIEVGSKYRNKVDFHHLRNN
jgi:hypothetical protein